jgi:hypothetical protein
MSERDKPDPVKAWLFAEKLLDEEVDRMAALDDEEFDREMAAMPDPGHVPTVGELIARGERRAHQRAAQEAPVPRRLQKSTWVVWFAVAAIGAVMIPLVVERREVMAWLRRDEVPPIGPDREVVPKTVTPEERAAQLREEGFAACDEGLWALCMRKLDEAQPLDPAGESRPGVQLARKAAYDGTHPRPPDYKP